MNKIASILLVLAAVLMAGCSEGFEKEYDLRVDAYEYTLAADEMEYHIYVYCSQKWTARFDSDQDWISIVPGTEHGSGTGILRFKVEYNDEVERAVNLHITSGEYSQIVHISQKYDSYNWEIQ